MRGFALIAALVTAATLSALGGCSTPVGLTPAEIKANWEAQNIPPAGYKRGLLAFLRTYLNDPTNIRDAAVSPPQRKEIGQGERYVVCVRYNERKDGRYAGVKEGMATFVSGKLDRFFDAPPREVKELCKDAAYAPFPELQTLSR